MKQGRESCFSEAFQGDRNHDKPRSFCTLQNDPSFEIFPPIVASITKLSHAYSCGICGVRPYRCCIAGYIPVMIFAVIVCCLFCSQGSSQYFIHCDVVNHWRKTHLKESREQLHQFQSCRSSVIKDWAARRKVCFLFVLLFCLSGVCASLSCVSLWTLFFILTILEHAVGIV